MHSIAGLVVCTLLSAAPRVEQVLPGRVIVKLAPGVKPTCVDGRVRTGAPGLDLLLDRHAVSGTRPLVPVPDSIACAAGADRIYLLAFPPDADVHEVTASLAAAAGVEGAWPDEWLPLDSVPDDSMYRQQWHLAHIGAPGAWAIAHGDSNVKLAVIADGVHWTHPDLEANLWVNAAEDINHSGRFEPSAPPQGDLDGIDQDGNGYIDDVIGYDFHDRDPNPVPSGNSAYSTRCNGVQNAVTDNNRGVSAPPWNVRSIALRCGDDGSVSLSAAISAVYYLIRQGAWAFTVSGRHTTPNPMYADACLAAWNSGRIPCATVGYEGSEVVHYPAAYDSVLVVAAHGRANMKSSFSNYGTWVDITAPGEDILTTHGPSGYTVEAGLEEHVVVGALGWVKSAYPGIGRDSALAVVRRMCDTMPDPLYWQGKLGWGRIRMSVPTASIAELPATGFLRPVPVITVVRGTLRLAEVGAEHGAPAELLDACGRRVMLLSAGANDVSRLAAGVYFVTAERGRPLRVAIVR